MSSNMYYKNGVKLKSQLHPRLTQLYIFYFDKCLKAIKVGSKMLRNDKT